MRLWPLVLLVAGCAPAPTTLLVTIDAPGLSLQSLHVAVRLDGGANHDVSDGVDGGAVAVPSRLRVLLPDVIGTATVSVVGQAGGCRLVGSGSAASVAHAEVPLPITLTSALAAACCDGQKNGDESAVDCGGSCQPCAADQACNGASDCASGVCDAPVCVLATAPPFWIAQQDLPTAVTAAAAASTTTDLVVVGGDTWQQLPLVGSTWSSPFSIAAGDGPTMAALDPGHFVILGGLVGGAPSPGASVVDTTTGAQSAIPAMNVSRVAATAVLAQGGIWVFGSDAPISDSSFETWRPGDAAWRQAGAIPMGRRAVGTTLLPDGRIAALGGIEPNDAQTHVNDVFAFSLVTEQWSQLAGMPSARDRARAALAPDGRVYATGGETAVGTLHTVEAYSAASDHWTTISNMINQRSFHAITIGADGRVYVAGGSESVSSNSVEAYGPMFTLDPPSVSAGSAATLRGSNFAASATVRVYLDAVGDFPLESGSSAADGQLLPIQLTVPAGTTGTHRLIVIDDRSQYPVSAPLQLD